MTAKRNRTCSARSSWLVDCAASDLADANAEVDLGRIIGEIGKLTEDESREIRANARAVLRKLEGRSKT